MYPDLMKINIHQQISKWKYLKHVDIILNKDFEFYLPTKLMMNTF